MSDVLIDDGTMGNIGEAIREKLNESDRYTPSQMPSAIRRISVTSNLADLNDVDVSTVEDGQVLKYDGENDIWVNSDTSNANEMELTQAQYDALTEEEKMNGTTYYITDANSGESGGGGASALSELTDVGIDSLEDGQILLYNEETSKWENSNISINDILEISVDGATTNELLVYSGGTWNNTSVSKTINSNPQTITNAAAAIPSSCQITMDVSQSGSGTPSLSNPRPANLITSATIAVTDVINDATHYYTQEITDEFYGGVWDPINGKLYSRYKLVNISDLEWSYSNGIFSTTLTDAAGIAINVRTPAVCSCYDTTYYSNLDNVTTAMAQFATNIYIKDSTYTDVSSFVSAMSGQTIVYLLDNDYVIDVDIIAVKLYRGTNTIRASCSESRARVLLNCVCITAPFEALANTVSTSGVVYEKHYSTDEQVIGTWIDGKTLYERCFKILKSELTSSGTNKYRYAWNIPFNEVCDARIMMYGNGRYIGVPNATINSSYVTYIGGIESTYLEIYVAASKYSNEFESLVVVIQYTKV